MAAVRYFGLQFEKLVGWGGVGWEVSGRWTHLNKRRPHEGYKHRKNSTI